MNQKKYAELEHYALTNGLNYDELVEGIKLIQKHRTIIARSGRKLSEWQGENYAPQLLGILILAVLQLSIYDDPEYMNSALVAMKDIYAQALRDNASASELFEVMAQTSYLEGNLKPTDEN
jgi:hypothetical protein